MDRRDSNHHFNSSPGDPKGVAGEATLYPGHFRDIDEVVENCWQRVKKELQRRGFGPDEVKIHMAVAEAIINAWKHGNQCRRHQPIIFRWRFNHQFTFEVLNQGPGFDHRQLPDPTEDKRLTAENGRGLFIINTLACSVHWQDHGRHLTVTFSLP